eukprot:scaffold19501_cov122-Isochrysis_galbana.AAC.1
MKIHPVSTMQPVRLVGRPVKHEQELGELKYTFSHPFSMVGGTNCTLHDNQVTQGPKRIVGVGDRVARRRTRAGAGARARKLGDQGSVQADSPTPIPGAATWSITYAVCYNVKKNL